MQRCYDLEEVKDSERMERKTGRNSKRSSISKKNQADYGRNLKEEELSVINHDQNFSYRSRNTSGIVIFLALSRRQNFMDN